ncbi:hypothetical protein [Mucilaginibacter sp. HD30]
MMEKKYSITLYNTQFFSDILTYEFPVLPEVGDMIEAVNQRTMFIVKSRSFTPHFTAGLIHVMLHGVFENGEEMGLSTFDKIRNSIIDNKETLASMHSEINNHIS